MAEGGRRKGGAYRFDAALLFAGWGAGG